MSDAVDRPLAAKMLAAFGVLLAGCGERTVDGLSRRTDGPSGVTPATDSTPTPAGTASPGGPAVEPSPTPGEPAPTPAGTPPEAGRSTATQTPPTPEQTPEQTPDHDDGENAAGDTSGSAGVGAGGSSTTGGGGAPASPPDGGSGGGAPSGGSGGSTPDGTPNGGSGGGSSADDGQDDSMSHPPGGPYTVVDTDTERPFAVEETVSVSADRDHLWTVRLDGPHVVQFAFGTEGDTPLSCHLVPRDQVAPYRDGESFRSYVAIGPFASYEFGPVRLSAGRYAFVVSPAGGDEARVTYSLGGRRG